MSRDVLPLKIIVLIAFSLTAAKASLFFGSGKRRSTSPTKSSHTSTKKLVSASVPAISPSKASRTLPLDSGVSLNFKGEFQHSESLNLINDNNSHDRMLRFFQHSEQRDILIKGGDNPLESVPASPELYDTWESQSQLVQSQLPDRTSKDDTVIAIYTTVPFLPGLSIQAVSYTGVKLLRHPSTGLPMYEFTLLREYLLPRGTKTMEWIYGKIAGNGQDNTYHIKDGDQYMSSPSRKTHALARVSLENDESKQSFRISYFGHVGVSCMVPRKLFRFLPLSKSSVEKKLSESIVKQLKREGMDSLKKYQQALDKWSSPQQQNKL